jgi:hypothetical protein
LGIVRMFFIMRVDLEEFCQNAQWKMQEHQNISSLVLSTRTRGSLILKYFKKPEPKVLQFANFQKKEKEKESRSY